MEYFKLLHLSKEPFSNSPDPAFFYASGQHKDCIQKLEIALRLRRGLNVVMGEVGTGKTTLCRQLIQAFSDDEHIIASLVLDPDFPDPRSFLSAVVHMMTGRKPALKDTIPDLKEKLKHYLFQRGVEEERTIVLIVDEGQKMSPACLETLRELLNFETNEFKLLQIVIFAQNEFADTLKTLPNLADRINLYYRLKPLSFKDFKALVQHRLQNATDPESNVSRLFSMPALWRIYRFSGGYPRKIIHLCHQCLLAMIIQNKTIVGWRMVGACARRSFEGISFFRMATSGFLALALVGIGLGVWYYVGTFQETKHPVQKQHEMTGTESFATDTTIAETTVNSPEPVSVVSEPAKDSILTAKTEQKPTVSLPVMTQAAEVKKETVEYGQLQQSDLSSSEPPGVLGTVQVELGDTLGGLIQKIYGAYTFRYNQAVLEANPRLTDPDRLKAGESLVFPAVSVDPTGVPKKTWWISIWRESDLGTAISRLREEASSQLPLRLLVHWNSREGLSFRCVLKTCFSDPKAAEFEKNHIELIATEQPEIIYLMTSQTVFFGSMPG